MEKGIQEIWKESSSDRKREIIRIAVARAKNVHSDSLKENSKVGCNPDIEVELTLLTMRTLYITENTTLQELYRQLGL